MTKSSSQVTPVEPPPPPYREAISRFATGVTVISTTGPNGPVGMTASAVSSLSLEPLLMLVCINNRLPTHEALLAHGRFAVNVLGEGDEELALRFARPAEDKFAGLDVDFSHGAPVLPNAIAHFICDLHEHLPGGDHSIFIGRVEHCDFVPHRRPLLYFGSAFGGLQTDNDPALDDAHNWEATMRM